MTNVVAENNYLKKMKIYAKENDIPIMLDDGLSFLCDTIKKNNIKNILEIGSAIGYSASIMHYSNDCNITTIERDDEMYLLAKTNIEAQNLENKIRLIHSDALDAFALVSDKKYDLIFIDAAKGKYQDFFKMFSPLLDYKGLIVCDNMSFHGLVENIPDNASRQLKSLIKKIKAFIEFLKDNDEYVTDFFEIGDGVSISRKKILA